VFKVGRKSNNPEKSIVLHSILCRGLWAQPGDHRFSLPPSPAGETGTAAVTFL